MNKRAWLCSLFLAVIWTFGLMLSSSPLLSLHSTCCVASPPTPKLRAWRGENSCRHICRENTTARHPRVESLGHRIWRCSWMFMSTRLDITHCAHNKTQESVWSVFTPNWCMSWTRESPTNRTSGSLSLLSDTKRLCYTGGKGED